MTEFLTEIVPSARPGSPAGAHVHSTEIACGLSRFSCRYINQNFLAQLKAHEPQGSSLITRP